MVEEVVSSVSWVTKDYLRRLAVNSLIAKNKYLCYPVESDHVEYVQLGRGGITSRLDCGRPTVPYVCRNREGHKHVVFNGVDFTGKDAVKFGHIYCSDPDCCVCFLGGYGVTTARHILGKLNAGVSRGFGEIEHGTISFGAEVDLPVRVAKKLAIEACLRRGLDGVLLTHGRRIRRETKTLKWGLHFHFFGFVKGTYGLCRNCKFFVADRERPCCVNPDYCEGFEQRTRRFNVEDGAVVKIHGKRTTVMGSLTYVLSHCTHRVGLRSEHMVSYFGAMKKGVKAVKVETEHLCEVCGSHGVRSEMVRSLHVGDEVVVTDLGSPWYLPVFPSSGFDSKGNPSYVDFEGADFEGRENFVGRWFR